MVLEECWNISKNELLVLAYYKSFTEFRIRLGQYFSQTFQSEYEELSHSEYVRELILIGVSMINEMY